MAHSIEISPATFKRLQSHAVPLVDTIETVITRMIDSYESGVALSAQEAVNIEGQTVRNFNADTPPDLTHAKILGVSFNGKQLGRGQDNWNGLLYTAVREARSYSKDHADFKKLMVVKHVEGDKQDEGYRPLHGTGVSVQGQDANGAWRAARHIAQQIGCELSVKFAWREKEGAAFPGVVGQMIINKI